MAADTKPNKVEGAGVAVTVDGKCLSRLQSFSTDTDLGLEEVRELANSNIVEFVEGTPTVTVQLEANMWGRRDNLAAITGMDGAYQRAAIAGGAGWREINQYSFDGTSCDILVQVEQDSTLARSMYIPAAYVTSLSFSFDVGGSATESYTLESDTREWYWGNYRDVIVVSGFYNAAIPSGITVVGNDDTPSSSYWAAGDDEFNAANGTFTPLFITKNGKKIIDPSSGGPLASAKYTGGKVDGDKYVVAPTYDSQFSAGARYRCVGYKETPSSTIPYSTDTGTSTPSSLGGIRKGMIEIYLVSGSMFMASVRSDVYKEEFLRLQTCSIDADLSREALDELGNAESFYRALNYPISVTVNFSALSSDLQEWHAFADKSVAWQSGSGSATAPVVQFREFVQNHGVLIKVYDDDESNALRKNLMTITVSGLRVASESFSVDAGGNGVQEFSCTADNFVVS